jgi:hypothetical protein
MRDVSTRREAIAVTAALALTPGVAGAAAPSDAATLIRLLRLERRLAALYDAALKHDLLAPDLARHLRDQEREHAAGLERALADLRVRAPRGAAPLPPLPTRAGFPALALRLEDEAVAAYVEAIANLHRPGLLQPLGSIAASEGQHQVILRRLHGDDPLR